nr:MAG TPA: hypothetical protein [Caudoviricetes sp.]
MILQPRYGLIIVTGKICILPLLTESVPHLKAQNETVRFYIKPD